MTEENQIKERGPGPFMMSVYIILFLIIGVVLSITIYKKYFAYPAAKVTVINVFHAQTVRYISRELEKCSLGDATAMKGLLNCSKYSLGNKEIKFLNSHFHFNIFMSVISQ